MQTRPYGGQRGVEFRIGHDVRGRWVFFFFSSSQPVYYTTMSTCMTMTMTIVRVKRGGSCLRDENSMTILYITNSERVVFPCTHHTTV